MALTLPLKNEEDSAPPLAAQITGYLSHASMRKGVRDRCWPFTSERHSLHLRPVLGHCGSIGCACLARLPGLRAVFLPTQQMQPLARAAAFTTPINFMIVDSAGEAASAQLEAHGVTAFN
jgi:hypothetical protein